jgi:hypothetical protein
MTESTAGQSLANRLAAVQRSRFVGRTAELELVRAVFTAAEPPFAVLHVYGPGGIGKTTFLLECQRLAGEAGVIALYLDGRSIEPSPPAFLGMLSLMLGGVPDPLFTLAQHERIVLMIDTYEQIAPLDDWLRDSFLPNLPGNSVTIIAGRTSPAAAWRTVHGWRDLTRILALRNLHPEESRRYLQQRHIREEQHEHVLHFTHGHPLALALVADALNHGSDTLNFDPQQVPDVVRTLLERFVQQMPSDAHRQALEICTLARVTSESLLAAFFDRQTAHMLFNWLYGLSFIEHSLEGIFPHDLVRDVLDTDLRWRDPEHFRDLSQQIRRYLVKRVQQTRGIEQQQVMYSHFFLHRRNRMWQQYHPLDAFGHVYAEVAPASIHADLLALVQHYEGDESRRIAAYWLQRQPQAFLVFQRINGEIVGFLANLTVDQFTPDDLQNDPAAQTIHGFVQDHGGLRPGELVFLHRFWMGTDQYQTIAIQAHVELAVGVRLMSTPQLAWNFACVSDPDFWAPNFAYLNFPRCPEADFSVGDKRYGVFCHNWRAEPLDLWLEVMMSREMATDFKPEELAAQLPPPLLVLSQTEFEASVRHALRDYTQPDLLATNPLMRSRLILQTTGENAGPSVLQDLIRQAAESLQAAPKLDKLYRALELTYLKPAPTQEIAAERLDLPFSTYRRHLTGAVTRVTEWLWQRELYGIE